jgi:hypothetical protein
METKLVGCIYDHVVLRCLDDILRAEDFKGRLEEVPELLEYFPASMLGKVYKVKGRWSLSRYEMKDLDRNLHIAIEDEEGYTWYIPARFTKEYLIHGVHSFILPLDVIANIEIINRAIKQIDECLSELGGEAHDYVGSDFIDYFLKMQNEFGDSDKILSKITDMESFR